MKEKVSCAIYTRVSTDNQAEVEFNSCEAQKERIEHFIKSQDGFNIYNIYNDEGYSGKDLNKPAMQRMLGEIQKGSINCVITYKMDRLTRSPKDFYQLIEFFEKYNTSFISITERFDTSTPSGRLLRNIMLTFAQFERELISERVRDKMLQRAQKGMWNSGTVPYGYKIIDKKLIADEIESNIIKIIFEKYIESKSIFAVYGYLKQKGIYDRKGNTFSRTAIGYILRNVIYAGKIKYNGKIYQGTHKALIPEEIFNIAQGTHEKKPEKLRKYKEFLFSGLIKCEECGSCMTPYYVSKFRKGRHIRYYYYRCTCTFKRDWTSCSTRQINANRLEEYVFDNLKRISNDEIYIDNLVFRHNHESSYPKAEKNSLGVRSGLELDQPCLAVSSEIFRRSLKDFVFAAEKSTPTVRSELIKQTIKSIQYSKEMIRVKVYYNDQIYDNQNSLKHVEEEHCARLENSEDNILDYKMLGMQKKSNYVQNITGGEQCDPKRSAEDRSAKGNPPSEAMSRAHESEREAKAERGTKERRKNEFVLERWLRLSDEIRTYFKGSLEVKI